MDLKQWFLENQRDLPWRDNPTPYQVWVSEVMLQQTQVETVIPYYFGWMRKFPDIETLSLASESEVIKAWEGLGYYSRARNLHAGSKYVMEHWRGYLPASEDELKKIKGLGPYTIGAILGFAFKQKAAAVDGNVVRVLTRFFAIEEDISKSQTIKKVREKTYEFLQDQEPWVMMEALIELGATVCKKKALCAQCPLKGCCLAFKKGLVDKLPIKSKKIVYQKIDRAVLLIENGGKFLVRQVPKGEIMEGLFEFPYVEGEKPTKSFLNLEFRVLHSLPPKAHSFTRFRCNLHPYRCLCLRLKEVSGYQWVSRSQLGKLAFSSGHKKLLASL